MVTIERNGDLRSAFLKIGWAPLITICGVIILCIVAVVMAFSSIPLEDDSLSALNHSLATIKIIIVGSSLLSLIGYFLTYAGFSQASKALRGTPAGSALSTIRVIFMIFTITSAISFLFILILPDTMSYYMRFDADAAESLPALRMGAILMIVYSIFMVIFSIAALFILRNKMRTAYRTTNIKSLHGAYVGANMAVYTFFASVLSGFISGLAGPSNNGNLLTTVAELITIGLAIYALVRWIGGWLGAAGEVMHHPVEAEEYPQQYN